MSLTLNKLKLPVAVSCVLDKHTLRDPARWKRLAAIPTEQNLKVSILEIPMITVSRENRVLAQQKSDVSSKSQ